MKFPDQGKTLEKNGPSSVVGAGGLSNHLLVIWIRRGNGGVAVNQNVVLITLIHLKLVLKLLKSLGLV